MLANRLLFLSAGTRHAVTFRAGDHSPLFVKSELSGVSREAYCFLRPQFPTALLPISPVNSSGLRSSIIANFPLRAFRPLGDGAQARCRARDFSERFE